MNGMHVLSTTWGGAGFVVYPAATQDVHPALLAAFREYDPDAVLVPPGSWPMSQADRTAIMAAQIAISAQCSNFRSPIANEQSVASPSPSDLWEILFEHGKPGSGRPTALDDAMNPRPPGITIGVNPAVVSSIGLAAASRWGLPEPPTPGSRDVDPAILRRAVRRLASSTFDPTNLTGITNRDNFEGTYATDLALTLCGLEGAQGWGPGRADAVVVWGDEPDDFALAMAWDRTYGMGVWLPDEWWTDNTIRSDILRGIDTLAADAYPRFRRVLFTSTSLNREELTARVEECRNSLQESLKQDVVPPPDQSVVLPAESLPFSRYFKTHYVLAENLAHEWSTTVYEDSGTIAFAMLPRVPLIGVRGLEPLEKSASWFVDVTVRDHDIPVTTAIPEPNLLANGEDSQPTRVRASRNGISYGAYRSDVIPVGATVSQSLTRPLLRYPSLLEWASARAQTNGLTVKPSVAGTQATVIAKMMGGRQALTELIASDLLPALKAFQAKGATRDAYPDQAGCVLDSAREEGYLHFEGLCLRTRNSSSESQQAGPAQQSVPPNASSRDQIDRLLRWGVLRRGLILRCPFCNHLAFTNIEDLGNTIRCPRCTDDYPLERERWRSPVSEPRWFYDLHPTARALLKGNGDVPLLLSAHLRTSSRRAFTDAPEFELQRADGSSEVETDLLALVDRQLVIAEAKSNGTFGSDRNAAATKRVRAARLFQADQIILATTTDVWEAQSISAMRSAIADESWPARPPTLRIVTRLGGSEVIDALEQT